MTTTSEALWILIECDQLEAFLADMQRTVVRELKACADRNGLERAEITDQLIAEVAANCERMFAGWLEVASSHGPEARAAMERELEPVRALLQKRMRDFLCPH